jgi:hypothetical protein
LPNIKAFNFKRLPSGRVWPTHFVHRHGVPFHQNWPGGRLPSVKGGQRDCGDAHNQYAEKCNVQMMILSMSTLESKNILMKHSKQKSKHHTSVTGRQAQTLFYEYVELHEVAHHGHHGEYHNVSLGWAWKDQIYYEAELLHCGKQESDCAFCSSHTRLLTNCVQQ